VSNLTGKTILITRAAHQAEDLVSRIEQLGGTPILFPTIEIRPPDAWDACDRAIEALYMYDGLIFTSTNGVELFTRRMEENGHSIKELQSKIICVVGEKTQRTVERLGLKVTAMPAKFTAVDLATTLQQENLQGKTFLFPRGNLANDTLPEMLKRLGAAVDAVTVYRTQKPKQENTGAIRTMLLNGKIDVATFTSPSSVHNFVALFSLEEVRRFHNRCKFAVIGPTTRAAFLEIGIEVDIVANKSTMQGLVESITQYFQPTSHTAHSAFR
jgi:uroporphyrinogen III methyltransferase/synthase